MAILTFNLGEGLLETFGASGKTLEYVMLFNNSHGWLSRHEAAEKILKIRDVKKEEAAPLAKFLLESKAMDHFKHRMASEDWELLQAALPVADGPDSYCIAEQ
jgi:hypothetical protein